MRELLFSSRFPYKTGWKRSFANVVLLGIGGNVGATVRRLENLWRWFGANKRFLILSSSPIYKNPPFGCLDQDDFYNAVITLATDLSLIEVFGLVFYLERRFGRQRKRAFKNSPRTLDVDIIFFNDLILKHPYLKIPHPQWHSRESVLVPLFLEYLIPKGRR